jgi:hypothetical protein
MKVVCPGSILFLQRLLFAAKLHLLSKATSQLFIRSDDVLAVAETSSPFYMYSECFVKSFARSLCRQHDTKVITDDVLRSSLALLDDLNTRILKLSKLGAALCKSVETMPGVCTSISFGILDEVIDAETTPESLILLVAPHQGCCPAAAVPDGVPESLQQLFQLVRFCKMVHENGFCNDAAFTPKDASAQALSAWLYIQTKIEYFMTEIFLFPEVSSNGAITGVWTELSSEQHNDSLNNISELLNMFVASTMVVPDTQNPAQTSRRAIVLGVAAAIVDCIVRAGGKDDRFVKLIQNRVIATTSFNSQNFEAATNCMCLTATQGFARDKVLRYQKARIDGKCRRATPTVSARPFIISFPFGI